MTTKFVLACFLAVALLGVAGQPALAQEEVTPDECYGGVTTTSFAVYDPDISEYVEIRFSCLPWWWEPAYLPFGWIPLTAAIVPVVWYKAAYVGGVVNFGRFHYHNDGFRRHHGHFGHFRGNLHGRFSHSFNKGRSLARGKYPGLKKPPGFRHAGHGTKGHTGSGKPDAQRGPGHNQPAGQKANTAPAPVRGHSPAANSPAVRPPKGGGTAHPGQTPARQPGAIRPPRTASTPHQSPSAGGVRPPRTGGSPSTPGVRGPQTSTGVRGPQPGTRGPQSGVRGPAGGGIPRGGPAPHMGGGAPAPRGGGSAPRGGGGRPAQPQRPHK